MTQGSRLADRLVSRLFGTPPEPEPVEQPKPPMSVKARLDDARKSRATSARKMRQLRMF
jgi:hypothetical protein